MSTILVVSCLFISKEPFRLGEFGDRIGSQLMRMSPEQCRAARAWLGWTQQKMASYARVGLSTIKEFEKGGRRTIPATLAAMQQTLERAGVTFVNDPDGKPTGIQVCAMGPPPLLEEVGHKPMTGKTTGQSRSKRLRRRLSSDRGSRV